MFRDRVMRKRLEPVIDVVCAVKGLKCCLCFSISEPEPGVPGQRDTGAVVAGYTCCLCCASMYLKCCLCFGISELEPGVPGQRDTVAVIAGYKSRLCCAST